MNDIQFAKILGLFSLGLGAFELLASRRIAASIGVGSPTLVKALGAREIATGLVVLNAPDQAMPVWGRVAGDAMDAAVLARGFGSANSQRGGAVGAMLFVLATTALDVAVAASLNQRQQTALQTGRRTRVRRAVSST